MLNKCVYIQGIYSTALSKLFKDAGFVLAFPSKTISKRLNLEITASDWTSSIISDPQIFGLKIFGEKENVEEVLKVIKDNLEPIVVRKSKVNLGMTAIGTIEKEDERKSLVSVKNIKGYVLGRFPQGSKVLVSTRKPVFEEEILFSNGISLAGKYLMLVQNGDVQIPNHIMNSPKGKKLLKITEELLPKGWGVTFFESCIGSDEKDIKEELSLLISKSKSLTDKDTSDTILHEGIAYIEVYLTYESKRRLDEIRNDVLPTIKDHHYLRNFGQEFNVLIHFAENLLANNVQRELIEQSINESLFEEIFKKGKFLEINHYKADGKLIKLSPGKIISTNKEEKSVTLMRKIKGIGYYDGIGAKKEIGDFAIATYKLGSLVSRTYYYRKDKSLIGTYSNFSTPIEIYPNAITYVDLEIDIAMNDKGEIKIIDKDKLEDLVVKEIISEKLYWRIIELVEKEKKELLSLIS